MLPSSSIIARLFRNDLRLVARDRLLVMLLSLVAVLAVVVRFVLPQLDASLARNGILPNASTALRFSDTFALWVVFIGLWQAALMPGTVFAFLLLDEKEDGTLVAMRVTPVPLSQYLGYRVTVPAVFAFVFAVVLTPAIGFAPVPAWQLILFALGAATTAPIVTLLIAMFAADKVQGFAFTKFGGIAGLIIIFGWFTPAPWQWLLCAFPPFAIAKGYWMAVEGAPGWWAPLIVGSLVQLWALRALLGRLARRAPA